MAMKLTIGDVFRIIFSPEGVKVATYDEAQAANERADMLAEICEERDEDRRADDRMWAEVTGMPIDSEPTSTARAARTAGEALGRKPGEAIYDAARRVVKERDEAIARAAKPVREPTLEEMLDRWFASSYSYSGKGAATFGLAQWRDAYAAAMGPCTVPPEGWSCSRARGHEGPCAASPKESS